MPFRSPTAASWPWKPQAARLSLVLSALVACCFSSVHAQKGGSPPRVDTYNHKYKLAGNGVCDLEITLFDAPNKKATGTCIEFNVIVQASLDKLGPDDWTYGMFLSPTLTIGGEAIDLPTPTQGFHRSWKVRIDTTHFQPGEEHKVTIMFAAIFKFMRLVNGQEVWTTINDHKVEVEFIPWNKALFLATSEWWWNKGEPSPPYHATGAPPEYPGGVGRWTRILPSTSRSYSVMYQA